MENASKALIMAGGILIALMILGALMLMFSNLSAYQNQNDASTKDSQIAEFNNQFSPYDKSNLTLMELASLYNKIQSHNNKYPDLEIETNISSIYPNITTKFSEIEEEEKNNRRFKCKSVGYDSNGRINNMQFEQTK